MRTPVLLALCLHAGCGAFTNDSEAAVHMAKALDGATAYFRENHPGTPHHVCPHDGRAEGETGITPPLDVRCDDGPDGQCVAGKSYPAELWSEHAVWKTVLMHPLDTHRFHYNYKWTNATAGFGKCTAVIEAYRDGESEPAYVWRAEMDEKSARHSGNPVEGDQTSLLFITDASL
jgi:hypothetical protein